MADIERVILSLDYPAQGLSRLEMCELTGLNYVTITEWVLALRHAGKLRIVPPDTSGQQPSWHPTCYAPVSGGNE